MYTPETLQIYDSTRYTTIIYGIYKTQTYVCCNLLWSETHAPCYDTLPPEIPPRDEGANPSDEATKATNINSDEMKRFIVLYSTVR